MLGEVVKYRVLQLLAHVSPAVVQMRDESHRNVLFRVTLEAPSWNK